MRLSRQFFRDIARVRERNGDLEGARRIRKMAELRTAWYYCRKCHRKHRYPVSGEHGIFVSPCRKLREQFDKIMIGFSHG